MSMRRCSVYVIIFSTGRKFHPFRILCSNTLSLKSPILCTPGKVIGVTSSLVPRPHGMRDNLSLLPCGLGTRVHSLIPGWIHVYGIYKLYQLIDYWSSWNNSTFTHLYRNYKKEPQVSSSGTAPWLPTSVYLTKYRGGNERLGARLSKAILIPRRQ